MTTRTYKGLLCLHADPNGHETVYLTSLRDCLNEELSWMSRKKCTVKFWISDTQMEEEQAKEAAILHITGQVSRKFGACYSELTGYLWTNDELKVGGHDLIRILEGYAGKWIVLKIESH
jgi:hypothetical protein